MELISTTVDFNDEEAVVCPVTEKTGTEAKKEVRLETTIKTGSSFSVYTTRDQRKREYDSSSDDDLDFLEDDDDEEEEKKMGKRLLTEEEKLSSHQEWYESQLEDNKQSLLKEMREKENKLLMIKWAQKRKESCVTSTSVDRLKEELALLRVMYEQLII